jgi:hypothetical protein
MICRSLIDKKFSKLPIIAIWGNGLVYRIPDNLSGFDSSIELLDEIVYSYQDDIKNNKHLLIEFPPKDITGFDRFRKRELWRIGSFIIFSLNLELTFKKRFNALLEFITNFEPNIISFQGSKLIERSEELKVYRYYRNKLFAHTAFGYPEGDSISTQATSITYFENIPCGITPEGIIIGGITVTTGEQDSTQFQQITFNKMASDFKNHFSEWHKMFDDLCEKFKYVTDEKLKEVLGSVDKITRNYE